MDFKTLWNLNSCSRIFYPIVPYGPLGQLSGGTADSVCELSVQVIRHRVSAARRGCGIEKWPSA